MKGPKVVYSHLAVLVVDDIEAPPLSISISIVSFSLHQFNPYLTNNVISLMMMSAAQRDEAKHPEQRIDDRADWIWFRESGTLDT